MSSSICTSVCWILGSLEAIFQTSENVVKMIARYTCIYKKHNACLEILEIICTLQDFISHATYPCKNGKDCCAYLMEFLSQIPKRNAFVLHMFLLWCHALWWLQQWVLLCCSQEHTQKSVGMWYLLYRNLTDLPTQCNESNKNIIKRMMKDDYKKKISKIWT